MQTKEERNRKRRECYARQKEWQAILEGYVQFAADMAALAKEERLKNSKTN